MSLPYTPVNVTVAASANGGYTITSTNNSTNAGLTSVITPQMGAFIQATVPAGIQNQANSEDDRAPPPTPWPWRYRRHRSQVRKLFP